MNPAQLSQTGVLRGAVFYLILCLVIFVFVWILLPLSAADFQRFFGRINPLLLYPLLSLVGAGALWLLVSRFGFAILGERVELKGLGLAAVLATVLGLAIVIADYFLVYPQDTNIPYPRALLFYPAAGFAAEVIFHLLPLALLLLVFSPLSAGLGEKRVMWIAILAAAAVEPLFQVLFSGEPLRGRNLYTLIHVFLIALGQLYLFRRFDFMTMYAMRLVYYLYWHILWGVLRLDILF
jgi:hypothetical protein